MANSEKKAEIESRIKELRDRGHPSPVHEAIRESTVLLDLDIKNRIGDAKMSVSEGDGSSASTWESLEELLGPSAVERIKGVGG